VTDAHGATASTTLTLTVVDEDEVVPPSLPPAGPPAPVAPADTDSVLPSVQNRAPVRTSRLSRPASTNGATLPRTGIDLTWLLALALALVAGGGRLTRTAPRHRG